MDKKPYKIETFGKYYKNLGASKGIIPESKKRELRGIFDRNREIHQDKNPWGSLAKNWNRDKKYCEKEPLLNEVEKPVEIKNPSIRVRLGTKKQESVEEKQGNEEENVVDEEEEEEDTTQRERKQSKIPRMRMYADEEEAKIKRKKLLQTLKKQAEKLSKDEDLNTGDLRNILGITNNKRIHVRDEVTSSDPLDLGTRLRNRTQNMVFTVERQVIDVDEYDRKENVQADIRSLIERRRAKSPLRSRRTPPRWSPQRQSPEYRNRGLRRSRSPIRKRSPIPRKRSPANRRKYEGTLHSDRMENDRAHRRRHKMRSSYYSEEEGNSHKPKSKVAVVIKTAKKPTVASTIWSRVQAQSESENESGSNTSSESDSSEEEGSSSSQESESEENSSSSESSKAQKVSRPGFRSGSRRLSEKINYKSPLKITMTNDRFKK